MFSKKRTYAQTKTLFVVTMITTVVALCLGGGTHGGYLADAVAQFVAISLLLLSVINKPTLRGRWVEVILLGLIVAIPVIQLIPLPPAVWMALPGHGDVVDNLRLAGLKPGWMPLTLTPEATALAALSLLIPAALFLAVRQMNAQQRRMVVLTVLATAAFSVFLGMAQIATGEKSALRFFDFTNTTEAVGFFANRNHFAALLYASLPFAAAWSIDSGLTLVNAQSRNRLEPLPVFTFVASATLIFLLGAAQIMARSRAGSLLAVLAMFGVAIMSITDPRNHSRRTSLLLIAIVAAGAILFTAQFGFYRFAERFAAAAKFTEARPIFARNTITAAWAYFPFGSGVGSFPTVYALFEKRKDLLIDAYANHAHDDFLEMWMEGGVLIVVVLALALSWFLFRSVKVWIKPDDRHAPLDRLIAQAATVAISLLLLHSLVDYPLRTSALMAALAICCALLTPCDPDPELVVNSRKVRDQNRQPIKLQPFQR